MLFIYFHFLHVKTSFSWRYFWTLAHLMHYLCSLAQPSPKITRLNVFCMFVPSPLLIFPPFSGRLPSEVGQGWANRAEQVTSRCPCCFNYCLLLLLSTSLWSGLEAKRAFIFPKCSRGNIRTAPCGNEPSLNAVIAPHSQISMACRASLSHDSIIHSKVLTGEPSHSAASGAPLTKGSRSLQSEWMRRRWCVKRIRSD